MRRKTISILLLLAISLSFLPTTFAQGKVAVVCNTIDNEMNPDFVSSLRKANLTVDFFGVKRIWHMGLVQGCYQECQRG